MLKLLIKLNFNENNVKNRIIHFRGVKFYDFSFNQIIKKLNKKGGVLVAPAASALVNINNDKQYYKALKNSDVAILDSGFFCILWRVFKKQKLNKFLVYLFLKNLIKHLSNKKIKILTIDPTFDDSVENKKLLKKNGINEIYTYVAPIYMKSNIEDKNLIEKIKKFKPKYILINIGGQTQEVLGIYIKKKIRNKINIICTGAAIAFMTKRQAPINDFIDKYYLGWLVRLIYGPKNVVTRILKSFLLIKFFV